VDLAGETSPAEVRDVSAVIDVRVRQNESVYLRRFERKIQIALVALASPTLEEPALEENLFSICRNQMLRARDGSCAAVKFDLQAVSPFYRAVTVCGIRAKGSA